jgi:hypothetical protein
MQFEEIKIFNPGLLCAAMPQQAFEELKVFNNLVWEYNTSEKGPWFYDTMRPEFNNQSDIRLPESYLKFLYEFSKAYTEYFNYPNKTEYPYLEAGWMNINRKHEFKSAHSHVPEAHDYEFLSFCTYINIPWDDEAEANYDATGEGASKNRYTQFRKVRNGKIEFFFNLLSGKQAYQLVQIDKSFEGKTILWPNTMLHAVYPFYSSDGHRVCFAGNIGLHGKKPT